MGRNIELKARARDVERQRRLAVELSGGEGELLAQIDTFFVVPAGRLKLRELAPDRGELIHYHRPDSPGVKQSVYSIVPTSQPAALRDLLAGALGVAGAVRKRRRLYLVGQTRVHIDEVEGLGEFLELEVVLRPEQTASDGERIAAGLREALDIRDEDLVDRAYVDLLNEQGA
jgi:adenylate cyclase class IV